MNTDKRKALFCCLISVYLAVHRWPFLFLLVAGLIMLLQQVFPEVAVEVAPHRVNVI